MGRFSMNETVKEWLSKAEGDYGVARRELEEAATPNYDAVCFHAQQCVEKLFKALLILRGTVPPKIHDLVQLGNLLGPLSGEGGWTSEELRFLSQAAITFRYPGESATQEDARKSLDLCARLRQWLKHGASDGFRFPSP